MSHFKTRIVLGAGALTLVALSACENGSSSLTTNPALKKTAKSNSKAASAGQVAVAGAVASAAAQSYSYSCNGTLSSPPPSSEIPSTDPSGTPGATGEANHSLVNANSSLTVTLNTAEVGVQKQLLNNLNYEIIYTSNQGRFSLGVRQLSALNDLPLLAAVEVPDNSPAVSLISDSGSVQANMKCTLTSPLPQPAPSETPDAPPRWSCNYQTAVDSGTNGDLVFPSNSPLTQELTTQEQYTVSLRSDGGMLSLSASDPNATPSTFMNGSSADMRSSPIFFMGTSSSGSKASVTCTQESTD